MDVETIWDYAQVGPWPLAKTDFLLAGKVTGNNWLKR